MAIRALFCGCVVGQYVAVLLLCAYKKEWNGWNHSVCKSTCTQEAVSAVHVKGT